MNVAMNSILERALPTLDLSIQKLIAAGEVSEFGGVLRYAKGHEKAGQIVKHLIFPENLEDIRKQLQSIPALSQQLVAVQQSVMFMGGLNLIATAASTAYLAHKIEQLDKKLDGISSKLDMVLNEIKFQQGITFALFNAQVETHIGNLMRALKDGDLAQIKTCVYEAEHSFNAINKIIQLFQNQGIDYVYTHIESYMVLAEWAGQLSLIMAHAYEILQQSHNSVEILKRINKRNEDVRLFLERMAKEIEFTSPYALDDAEFNLMKNLLAENYYRRDALLRLEQERSLCIEMDIPYLDFIEQRPKELMFVDPPFKQAA